jgi:hypothetical protein
MRRYPATGDLTSIPATRWRGREQRRANSRNHRAASRRIAHEPATLDDAESKLGTAYGHLGAEPTAETPSD